MHRLLKLSSFHALGFRAFRALWIGALVSNIGTWMSTVALGVTVQSQTGRAAWTGTVAALSFLPAVVLAPVAGALADRFERRRYLAVLNVAQMLIAATLALLAFTDNLSVAWMSVLALATGCASTLANPAFVAVISELVPSEVLPNALSLNSAQFNLGRIIGPALATAVFAAGGPSWAFAANALSFAAVLWALSKLPRSEPTQRAVPVSLWRDIREGFEVAQRDPGIRLALTGATGTALLVAPFIGMVPVYALSVFRRGPETASLFTTCQGIGAVCAALIMGPLVTRFGLRRVAVGAAVVLGPCALAYWSAPTPGWAAVGIAFLGGAYLANLTSLNTVEQLRAPRGAQARISSLHSMVLGGGYALGLVVMGALADRYDLRVVLGTGAFIYTAFAVLTAMLASSSIAALEKSPAASASGRGLG